ncbi:amidohydrolase family protein [Nocardioides sp. LHD-245]|uniref:amidohydrolase family protein n=1 Tax=Nocardioides sp. LHD-245 TaxID=3051387 RepID=UPI0027DFEEF3|nr:amidohydrolase family protein [Nocardioides sp. LHD-245]
MLVVDASVHVWSRDRRTHPWRPLPDPPHAAYDASPELLADALTGAGFAGAVLVQPSIYGRDHSFLGAVVASGAGRYAGIGLWDRHRSDPAGAAERDLDRHGLAGLRLSAEHDPDDLPWFAGADGDTAWDLAARRGQPLSVLCRPGHLAAVRDRAVRCPDVRVVVDHLGLLGAGQDPRPLLDLVAAAPNVGVRLSALGALSHEDWPHRDLWSLVRALTTEAGAHRLFHGTDWPFVAAGIPYDATARALDEALEWSDDDRAAVLGANAAHWWGMDRAVLAASWAAR